MFKLRNTKVTCGLRNCENNDDGKCARKEIHITKDGKCDFYRKIAGIFWPLQENEKNI